MIPKEALTQHIAILGKTRSGKSSVMRGLVEGLLKREQPVCIVDPKGDWWGIKLASDGRSPGYPVVIFGGEHADVPINAHAGAHVAELFATGNRPCLIDLGGWMVGERTRFWIDFASALFRHTKGMRWLAIDEIHNFAPKGKIMDPDAGKALHWANRLASEGLGKGLHMIFASQRPQKVHNDTLTSAETLIAMRVLHPSDRGAVAEWIKGCGDFELGADVLNSLAQMARGEGWAWSPEIGFGPERVKFPMFKTYDSFRPQSAHDAKSLKGWAEVDLEEVKTRLAAVVEEATANDPARLKAEIAWLKRAAPAARAALDTEAIELARQDGYRDGVEATRTAILGQADTLLANVSSAAQEVAARVGEAQRQMGATAPRPMPPDSPRNRADHNPIKMPSRSAPRPATNGKGEPMGKGERKVLTALAQYPEGVSREQLSILTGYKRSSRDTFLQRLRAAGHAETDGDNLTVTQGGIAALGHYEPLPIGDDLREYWLARLSGGEREILRAVTAAYPKPVPRRDLDEATGYRRSSRDTFIQRLKARKLISGGDAIRASEALFS